MIALWLLPPVLSLIVLAAHFLRFGRNFVVASLLTLVVVLIVVRRPWAARLAQVTLLFGALAWIRILVDLVRLRSQAGMPATRMAVILGGVALFTALSAFVFRAGRVRRWYGLGTAGSTASK